MSRLINSYLECWGPWLLQCSMKCRWTQRVCTSHLLQSQQTLCPSHPFLVFPAVLGLDLLCHLSLTSNLAWCGPATHSSHTSCPSLTSLSFCPVNLFLSSTSSHAPPMMTTLFWCMHCLWHSVVLPQWGTRSGHLLSSFFEEEAARAALAGFAAIMVWRVNWVRMT